MSIRIKFPFGKTLITAVAALLLAAPLHAQSKIGTVDLKKTFDGYWKTKQADANLKDRAAEFDKKRKEMVEEYKKANEDYKKLLDGSNDQAVSVEEREKRKKSAETKLLEIREIEQSVNQFDRSARTTLGEQQRRMRDNILEEIRNVINAKAKAAGYALVLDTAGETINNTPAIPYSDGKNDLTDEVLGQLNATAPLGTRNGEDKKDDGKQDKGKDEKKK
ncbi:MAG: OmpH family outer membrane protein [Pedosphaera parvula]|nr:OmpH family outer membrane protein [Pedosphaera parvula]